tara:strand:- start:1736 stop:3229 length:1494 start_codon:yes stop_codon:yes gene_type:complete
MAAAGAGHSELEGFYLSFRQLPEGWRGLYNPIDFGSFLAASVTDTEYLEKYVEWLKQFGFPVDVDTLFMAEQLSQLEIVYALPQGEWVLPREPILTVKGPRAAASWIEPVVVGSASYMMQVATLAQMVADASPTSPESDRLWGELRTRLATVTCAEQRAITHRALLETDLDPGRVDYLMENMVVDSDGYYDRVQIQCSKLLETGVSPSRIFEVGLRAATCMSQHMIALMAIRDMGFTMTSNMWGAYLERMRPVGTLGHEGIMRFGSFDNMAFDEHIKVLPKVVMLLDTNDTEKVGLPTAFEMMEMNPDRQDGVRPDSGDLSAQFRSFVAEMEKRKGRLGYRDWIFEDGLDEVKMAQFEALREELGYPKEHTLYGLGGFFIDRPEPTGFRRGRISMVYKLCWTDLFGPAMKFGNEAEEGASGKRSIPGLPVLAVNPDAKNPVIVAQSGCLPEGYVEYSYGDYVHRKEWGQVRPTFDEMTMDLIQDCVEKRNGIIEANS